jgi:hypothetical protein
VKNAENVAILASAEKVRGMEQINETTAIIAENPMVHTLWFDMVFRYLAPTRQWKPYNILNSTDAV